MYYSLDRPCVRLSLNLVNFCYISREMELQQMLKLNCLLCIVVIYLNTNNFVMLIKQSISLCLLSCLSCITSFSNFTTCNSYILMWHVGSLFYLTSVASHFLFACLTYTSVSLTSLFPSLHIAEVVSSQCVTCSHFEHMPDYKVTYALDSITLGYGTLSPDN